MLNIIDAVGVIVFNQDKDLIFKSDFIENLSMETDEGLRLEDYILKETIKLRNEVYMIKHMSHPGQNTFNVFLLYNKKHNFILKDWANILDAVKTAVFIDDQHGKTLWINKECELLYRVNREEIIGKSIVELEKNKIFSPSVAKKVFDEKTAVSIVHENRIKEKLLTTGVPIINALGTPQYVVSTSNDVTELMTLRQKIESMANEINYLKETSVINYKSNIFKSEAMVDIYNFAKKLSDTEASVFISGESGVGKGVVARLIHDLGMRKNQPFVQINCGAIPEQLLESELFGYVAGAFTGSSKDGKQGLFEMANKGTIFLDEIGELPYHLQVKLLTAIQNKSIQKIGSTKSIEIDVRIISATNKVLEDLVSKGDFREDLYYRINVIPIKVPPLRTRKEDIIALAERFIHSYNEKYQTKKRFGSKALNKLLTYKWPGNVRELENVLERIMVTSNTEYMDDIELFETENMDIWDDLEGMTLKEATGFVEKKLLNTYYQQGLSTREIATKLGVGQSTVVRKMNKYGLS